MKQKQKVFHLIIIDESGSMQSIKNETIKGFNELIQNIGQKEKEFPEQEHRVSLVTFNSGGIKTLLFNERPGMLQPLNSDNYNPFLTTPLYDAMGISINRLRAETHKHDAVNVLVTTLTDGLENASREYDAQAIKNLVEELKQKNWTFVYVGTEHDVFSVSKNLGILNCRSFEKHKQGENLEHLDYCYTVYCRKIENKMDVSGNFFEEEGKQEKEDQL